jgi:hypothetical protein
MPDRAGDPRAAWTEDPLSCTARCVPNSAAVQSLARVSCSHSRTSGRDAPCCDPSNRPSACPQWDILGSAVQSAKLNFINVLSAAPSVNFCSRAAIRLTATDRPTKPDRDTGPLAPCHSSTVLSHRLSLLERPLVAGACLTTVNCLTLGSAGT